MLFHWGASHQNDAPPLFERLASDTYVEEAILRIIQKIRLTARAARFKAGL